jgi:hypothetical protein
MGFVKQFLTPQYLFQINRVLIPESDRWFFVAGIVLAIMAIVFKLGALYAPDPVNRKYRQKFFSFLLSIGLAEMVWYGARAQNVSFFGTHFTAWLIVLIGLVWLVMLMVKMFRDYGKEKRQWEKEQVKLKYLPK